VLIRCHIRSQKLRRAAAYYYSAATGQQECVSPPPPPKSVTTPPHHEHLPRTPSGYSPLCKQKGGCYIRGTPQRLRRAAAYYSATGSQGCSSFSWPPRRCPRQRACCPQRPQTLPTLLPQTRRTPRSSQPVFSSCVSTRTFVPVKPVIKKRRGVPPGLRSMYSAAASVLALLYQ
jgi:hypothetical protein